MFDLAPLENLKSLHTLTLNLSHNRMGDGGTEGLQCLIKLPSLTNLSLKLRHNELGKADTECMNLLFRAKLHTLFLDLGCNRCPVVMQDITKAHALCNLSLGLSDTGPWPTNSPGPLPALCANSTRLRTLRLEMRRNGLGPEALMPLSMLSSNLQELGLDFSGNPLGPGALSGLTAAISQAHHLKNLALGLRRANLSLGDAESLGRAVQRCRTQGMLRQLSVDFSHNQVSWQTAPFWG
uniref:Uncharacterized protein n=1 Tax=Eutreptiella gymnastica TaxID=73025 RepID=A0A7S1IFT3_9EUGL